jgi:hypothetical protein
VYRTELDGGPGAKRRTPDAERSMKKVALILCLSLFAERLYAQQARSGYTGFALTSPLEISGGQDSNFLVDRTTNNDRVFFLSLPPSVQRDTPLNEPKTFSDQVFLLNAPTLSFLSDSPRREFALNYKPEFELFRQNGDQNSWNHYFTGGFAYLLNRKTEIFAGDTLNTTQDPARTMQVVSLLLPRSHYRENSFRVSLSHSFTEATRAEVRLDDTTTIFSRFDPFQIRVLDTKTTGGTISLTHQFDRNQRVRGGFSVFRTRPINREGVADSVVDADRVGMTKPVYMEALSYQRMFGRTAIAEFTGGAVQGEIGSSFIWGLSADKRFGDLVLGGGYSRSVLFVAGGRQFLAPGLQSNDVYDTATVRLRGKLSQHVRILFNVTGSQDHSAVIVKRSKSLMGRLRLTYQLTDHTAVFTNLETYRQNKNDLINSPLARNRIFFGLEYSFDPDANRAITDFAQEPEYEGLPGRGRRR